MSSIYLQDERENLLKEYSEKQEQLLKIKEELSQYAQGDPAVYEQKRKDIEAMKESALRWTGTTLSFTDFYAAAFLSGRSLMVPLSSVCRSDLFAHLLC